MTKVKATALKQQFLTLFKNAVQNSTEAQFYKRTISKSIGDMLANNVVKSL